MKTAWTKDSPYKQKRKDVPADSLQIEDTPWPGVIRSTASKYQHLFEAMRSGQCIACNSSESSAIAAAMRKHFKSRGRNPIIRTQSKCEDGKGRVWLIRADPVLRAA